MVLLATKVNRLASSIYIHIPFCRHACAYCDFYFLVTKKKEIPFFQALKQEFLIYVEQRKIDFKNLKSIYFGGGTPSFVAPGYIKEILNLIVTTGQKEAPCFDLSNLEVTLEANPEDLISGRLAHYRQIGINRISLGIQSFRPTDLDYLGRVEPTRVSRPVERVLEELQGWKDWSLDLIYGMPTLNHLEWSAQIDKAISYKPPHLSLYTLTIEAGTPLAYKIYSQKKPAPAAEQVSRQFIYASKHLAKAGYEHYEISNYALNQAYSLHNLGYWSGDAYLGLGPAAHTYDGVHRSKNFSSLKKYLDYLNTNQLPVEKSEILKPIEQFNETIMIALRQNMGCDLLAIERKFGVARMNHLLKRAKPYIESAEQKLYIKNHHLIASLRGKTFLDRITSDLFEE